MGELSDRALWDTGRAPWYALWDTERAQW